MLTGDMLNPGSRDVFQAKKSETRSGARPRKRPGSLRVLVVDDDFAIKVLVSAMLDICGCMVDRAEDGFKALDFLESGHYDLVLTDLQMPMMDGYSLACKIRARRPDTKIVIMTGAGRDHVRALSAGGQVDAWIFKPFGMREIRQLIDGFESR